MTALYRPRRLRDPRVVPTEPVEVDWSHPLSAGLVGLVVPGGARGPIDLCGNSEPLTAVGGAMIGTAAGGSYASTAAGQYLNGVAGAALNVPVSGTMFWMGTILGATIGGTYNAATVISVACQNASVAPYDFYAIQVEPSSLLFAAPTFSVSGSTITMPTSGVHSMASTFVLGGGAIDLYLDAGNVGSGTWSGSAPSYSNTTLTIGGDAGPFPAPGRSSNTATGLAAFYDAALPDDLLAWLAAEPFAMLRPRR